MSTRGNSKTSKEILHPEIPIVGYDEVMTEDEFLQCIKSRSSGSFSLGDLVRISPERDAENRKLIESMFEPER